MVSTRHLRFLGILGLLAPLGCGATDGGNTVGFVQSAKLNCNPVRVQSEPFHMLIVDLMHRSVMDHVSLTQLYVGADGSIQFDGELNPESATAGALEMINGEDDECALARQAIVEALTDMGSLPPYEVIGMECEPFCDGVPAYSVPENVEAKTELCTVTVTPETEASWDATHKAFGKVCPGLKKLASSNDFDPAGDGSTNDPPSSTVSATGVKALSNGLCPAYAPVGTYCKLSYASGTNWTGRKCKYWYGAKRCLLY
jgi:hypothetical protein